MAQLGLIDTFLENTSILFYNDFCLNSTKFKYQYILKAWWINGTKGNNSYIAIFFWLSIYRYRKKQLLSDCKKYLTNCLKNKTKLKIKEYNKVWNAKNTYHSWANE